MLQEITEDGTLHWNCHHDACAPLQAHLSHESVEWCEPGLVALPPCACGARTFIKTHFDEKDLAPPIIEYNPDGSIASVQIVGAPNLTVVEQEMHRYLVPHPEKPGELIPAFALSIKSVQPHPAIARHQKLHTLLHANGKPAPQKADVSHAHEPPHHDRPPQ